MCGLVSDLDTPIGGDPLPLANGTPRHPNQQIQPNVVRGQVVPGRMAGFENPVRPGRRGDQLPSETNLNQSVVAFECGWTRVVPHRLLVGSWDLWFWTSHRDFVFVRD